MNHLMFEIVSPLYILNTDENIIKYDVDFNITIRNAYLF